MDAKVEDKHLITHLENAVQHNSAITSPDIISICPVPVLGTNDFQRIGSKITPKYLRVSGVISCVYTDMGVNHPIMARVIAFKQNNVKSYASSASVSVANLLRGINGLSQGYNGDPLSDLLPLNDELFTRIYDRKFKLSRMRSNLLAVEGSDMNVSQVRFSFKVKCPKTLKFDDTSAFYNNFAPFMGIGYCYEDGTPADLLATPVQVSSIAHLKFEDA